MAVLDGVSWIIGLITIAFCCSSFGNGANDVANSYATSVAARTLTMPQVGVLSAITEFVGAVALGSRVTDTIKNDIIDITRFTDFPSTLVLAMGCAEFGSATWLITATRLGFPVSTTQTIVGALIGVGIASEASIQWAWDSGSVSQIAASWGVAPGIAAAIAAIIFCTLKFCILERNDSFKKALRAIPFYLAFTAAMLALFLVIEIPSSDGEVLDSPGIAAGVVLGVFGGVLVIAYVFFVPYFHRRLVKEDSRIRAWHIPLGPLLWRDDPPLYFPGEAEHAPVVDYYEGRHTAPADSKLNKASADPNAHRDGEVLEKHDTSSSPGASARDEEAAELRHELQKPEPEERWLHPVRDLPIWNPKKLWNWTKYCLLQGVSRDCVSYDNEHLKKTHQLAMVYENRVEHLWTYCQVASAMIMSIAHGSNDVANALGPWVAAYNTWRTGVVDNESGTPIWIIVVAGLLLGAGFWFFGYHIIRSLGNRITQMSPTRGFSVELGAAITVLMASRLGLPVSTTQCLCGAVVGVALCNLNVGAVNWRQMLFIFCGWVLTLPCAGLISGLLMAMALNSPGFGWV